MGNPDMLHGMSPRQATCLSRHRTKGSNIVFRAAIAGIFGMLICGCDSRIKITEDVSFAVAAASSDGTALYSCEEVIWVSDSVLIVTARNNRIQAFDANSGKELWGKEFDKNIDAVACSSDHVFIALRTSVSEMETESIRRLDVADGADSTPKGIPQPFLIHALVWSTELKALCILEHEALWIYSDDLLTVTKRIPYSGLGPFVSSDGKSVLLAERTGACSVIDLKAGSNEHIHGPPSQGRSGMIAIDAPFLSNAFHFSGGGLIRIIDNSWATGEIHFHDTPKGKSVVKDSKNGHAVAGVHWPTQRLAVSGTEKNLLLYSTKGTVLGEIKGATTERTYAISFSPSGSKVATLGSDGRVKIFIIR